MPVAKQELHAAMLQLRLAVRRHVADELDRADRGTGLQAAQPGRQEVQRQRMRGGETQRGRAAIGDGARLVNDAGITRGGCVIESDIGVVDASIETRWRRAAAALGVERPWDEATAGIDADTDTTEPDA